LPGYKTKVLLGFRSGGTERGLLVKHVGLTWRLGLGLVWRAQLPGPTRL